MKITEYAKQAGIAPLTARKWFHQRRGKRKTDKIKQELVNNEIS